VSDPLKGHWHRQDFVLENGAQVLARYSDGAPAATLNEHGQGRGILFGTHFDVAALAPEASDHRRVFANLAVLAGVERPFLLKGGPLLDGHLLSAAGQRERVFILINHGPDPAQARVHLPGLRDAATVTDLFAEKELGVRPYQGRLGFKVPLDGYESTALLIE
jgi:hypothetical protein